MNALGRLFALLAAASLAAVPLCAAADDAVPVHHVRGVVTAASSDTITVKTADGAVTLAIGPKTRIAGVVPTTADAITSGTFIGTANVPGSSSTTARALEVVVFPPAMAGTGEGDYPWDLAAGNGGHSSMTNGTVAAPHSMMTNGTVMGVNNHGSKTVTLQYKGGSKTVTISPGVPIVRVVPGSKSLLATGAHVVATPGSAGGPARVVIVGEQGAVPPM